MPGFVVSASCDLNACAGAEWPSLPGRPIGAVTWHPGRGLACSAVPQLCVEDL
ncbi:protein of unassigned function [Methylobacterium oryzae CBMB20]|uniref:Protein of unassigned function n=1 Tax=Methylobacterium oryzae CBMB20 TaxID=693986 RepID=A0A089NX97_9HYPH|nr:protein of unassigned function [Methylobacterium oryzae CBMB20]